MIESRIGELAALTTAFCWTITVLAFESASKQVGSLAVNLLRLFIALIFLSLFSLFSRGMPFPLDASFHVWFWLSLSGVIAFVIGDLLLLQAFIIVGSRISMLIMASVPVFTALIGWLILKETLYLKGYFGMILTIGGIALVVLGRNVGQKQLKFAYPVSGVLLAFGGAVVAAIGLVLCKYGMENYNVFSATQIREIAGIIGLAILFTFTKAWKRIGIAMKNRKSMINILLGSFFGPFLALSFSLIAIRYTSIGVASTIMAIVPVLIIPPAVFIFKEKVTGKEIIGALIAIAGTTVLFL